MKRFLWLFLICCFSLEATDHLITVSQIEKMNEEELKDLNGVPIQIRGFLYQAEDGRLIAASKPKLKSCCVGSESKIRSQVVVYGKLPPPDPMSPSLVAGVFQLDPKFEEGKLIQYATLTQAEYIEESSREELYLLLLIVAALGGLYLIRRRQQVLKK